MAEARPHSLVSHLRSRGFNVSASSLLTNAQDEEYLHLRIPMPHTFARILKQKIRTALLELNKSIWPATPATLATVVFGVTWSTVQASSDSWLRSGWLAELLWWIDEKLNPLKHKLSIKFRVAYLAIIASGLGMFCIALSQRLLLRALLSWKGWAFTRQYIPLHVKLWGQAVRALAGGPTLGTFAYQAALPHQPLPWLAVTTKKTVQSLLPLLSSQKDIDELHHLANKFLKTEGPKLQRYLWLKHLTSRNYVTDYWNRYVYLMGRGPLVINSNYFVMDAFKTQPTTDPVFRAANLIFRMLEFEDLISEETLPPSMLRETVPLDMKQYARMFGTSRIPGAEVDEIQTCKSDWIVVTRRCRYFKLITRHQFSGKRLSHAELAHQLRVITEEVNFDRSSVVDTADLMALTALPRAQWARIRSEEFQDEPNRLSLETIEKASFIVHLHDQPADASPAHGNKHLLRQAHALFHGDGASLWFDKSIQLIVFEDGKAGLNAEHSWADAPMVSHMFEHATLSELHDVNLGIDASSLAGDSLRGDPLPIPTKIEFVISDALRKEAGKAKRLSRELANDLILDLLEFDDFGDAKVKLHGLSPDAIVQVALQLAYLRKQGKLELVYESCTARLFDDGRTETIRSLTVDSMSFCKAMIENKTDLKNLSGLLRKANDVHASLSRGALTGDGIDRHLFALYVVARGSQTPSAFLDYVQAVPWRLSTAQQPQRQTSLRDGLPPSIVTQFYSSGGGFAPADDEGYGVCYTFGGPNRIFFHVTSKAKSLPLVDATAFVGFIRQALRDIMVVIEKG